MHFQPLRTAILLIMVGLCFGCDVSAATQTDDETSLLPFSTTDQILTRDDLTGRTKVISGVVEQIAGDTLVLRTGAETLKSLDLQKITEIRFRKLPEHDEGLRCLQRNEWKNAVRSLRQASESESRPWARNEIRGALARSLRADRQFEECLETIEKILKDDADSRHVAELPLVWDERLAAADRIPMPPSDLRSASRIRQLTAASVWIPDAEHGPVARAVLDALVRSSRGSLRSLAEAQLWRFGLIPPVPIDEFRVQEWRRAVRHFDRRTRSGPEFIIGRALLLLHDYDNAATSLLWMPLVEPLDPPTTQACLNDAIAALENAGRRETAEKLRQMVPQDSK